MLRWFLYILGALAAIGAGAYYWLIVDGSGPSGGAYAIDMAEIRKLAGAIPGDKASEIRIERIAAFKMPFTAMIAGESWNEVDVPVYSYQIAFPASTIVIDTAIDGTQAAKDKDPTFDAAAYARLLDAMKTAAAIVVTHEHPDHIGGLTAHPDLAAVLPRTKLTKEQVDHPEKMFGLKFPDGALAGYTPLAPRLVVFPWRRPRRRHAPAGRAEAPARRRTQPHDGRWPRHQANGGAHRPRRVRRDVQVTKRGLADPQR
jgi:hypothetical protein